MARQLTAADARQSLNAHVAEKGAAICAKFGPAMGWGDLQRLLGDGAFVRYPCEVAFDAGPLEPGECAVPVGKGARPEDGYTVCVHPSFLARLDDVPLLVLYQLVAVNYGAFASADDAETFGAAALGLAKDDYYTRLCALADGLGGCAGA